MSKKLRLRCSHSNLEWIYIDAAIQKSSKHSLFSHIVSELKRIERDCGNIDCKSVDSFEMGIQRQFTLPDDYSEIFEKITKKTGIKDPSTIVSRLIITPLLQK